MIRSNRKLIFAGIIAVAAIGVACAEVHAQTSLQRQQMQMQAQRQQMMMMQQMAQRHPCVVQGLAQAAWQNGPNLYAGANTFTRTYAACHGYYCPPNPWFVPGPIWNAATCARRVR